MPGLDELRQRVEAAEQQFGLITTESRKYSERLTQLVSQMEQAHSEQHTEIAALHARLGQYEQENGQLKTMLMGLLQAVENGDGSSIGHTVRDMESRIGRLIGAAAALPDRSEARPETPIMESVTLDDEAPIEAVDIEDDMTAFDDELIEVVAAAPVKDEPLMPAEAPEPETVALDDAPDGEEDQGSDDEIAASAHNLLDRVEAAANALLAAGAEADTDDAENELTDEISALLERAVNGTSEDEVVEADDALPTAGEAMAEDADEMAEDPFEALAGEDKSQADAA